MQDNKVKRDINKIIDELMNNKADLFTYIEEIKEKRDAINNAWYDLERAMTIDNDINSVERHINYYEEKCEVLEGNIKTLEGWILQSYDIRGIESTIKALEEMKQMKAIELYDAYDSYKKKRGLYYGELSLGSASDIAQASERCDIITDYMNEIEFRIDELRLEIQEIELSQIEDEDAPPF